MVYMRIEEQTRGSPTIHVLELIRDVAEVQRQCGPIVHIFQLHRDLSD